jgi:hypothetical protein
MLESRSHSNPLVILAMAAQSISRRLQLGLQRTLKWLLSGVPAQ